MESVFNNGGMIGSTLAFNNISSYSPIEYVGGATVAIAPRTTSLTIPFSLSGGLSSTPAPGDLVLVSFATGSTVNRTMAITPTGGTATAYSTVADLYANDTYDTNLGVFYKKMESPVDTGIILPNGTFATTDAGAVTIQVWRGVDSTTPLDVAITSQAAPDSANAVIPGIETVTNNSLIVCIGAGAHNAGTVTYSAPSFFTDFLTVGSDGTNDVSLGTGSYVKDYAGACVNSIFTLSATDSTSFSYASVTLALRPASNANRKNSGIWNMTSAQLAATSRIGNLNYTNVNTIATESGIFSNIGWSFITDDGTKLYIIDDTNDNIKRYDFSVPWDASTLSTSPHSTLTLTTGHYYFGMYISPDGTYLFNCNGNNPLATGSIDRYTLTTPWDLSTATSLTSYNDASYAPVAVGFSPDGLRMFYCKYTSNFRYMAAITLSTPFDLTTQTSIQVFSLNFGFSIGTIYVPDNTGMSYYTRSLTSGVAGYRNLLINLTTPWDISTQHTVEQAPNFPNSYGFKLTSDGRYVLVLDSISNTLISYPVGEYR